MEEKDPSVGRTGLLMCEKLCGVSDLCGLQNIAVFPLFVGLCRVF